MNLYISTTYQKGVTIHPDFIQLWLFKEAVVNRDWDTLFIELSDNIPRNVLKQIRSHFKEIIIQLPEKITHTTVNLICELLPTLECDIRYSFYQGKGVEDVLLRNLWRKRD